MMQKLNSQPKAVTHSLITNDDVSEDVMDDITTAAESSPPQALTHTSQSTESPVNSPLVADSDVFIPGPPIAAPRVSSPAEETCRRPRQEAANHQRTLLQ